jgi:hypothetical protein
MEQNYVIEYLINRGDWNEKIDKFTFGGFNGFYRRKCS